MQYADLKDTLHNFCALELDILPALFPFCVQKSDVIQGLLIVDHHFRCAIDDFKFIITKDMIIDNQLWILLCQHLSHYENRGRGDDPILMTPLASYLAA